MSCTYMYVYMKNPSDKSKSFFPHSCQDEFDFFYNIQ